MPTIHDLDLSYEEAAHGVQSAIAYKMENKLSKATEPKHLRIGVDLSKSDMAALVGLLIERKIFTVEEYLEAIRLHTNEELHMHEKEIQEKTGDTSLSFR